MLKPNLPKKTLLPHLAIIVATVIWSAATPTIKLTLDYIPPFTFLFLRFLIVCILILPFLTVELAKIKVHFKDLFNIILLGLFSQAAIALIFWGLKYTTSLDTAVIGVAGPLLSVAAGHYLFKEKISSKIKLGVLLASVGTLVVVLEPIFTDNTAVSTHLRLLGNILVFGYTIGFLLYIIWSKLILTGSTQKSVRTFGFLHIRPMKNRYSPFILTGLSFFVALACFVPLVVLETLGVFGPYTFSLMNVPTTGIVGLLYMAIFSSIAAYLLSEWGLETVTVTDTSLYSYLGPIFTLPFSFLLLSELPTPTVLLGSTIIAVGVYIAEHEHRRKTT